MKPPYFTEAVRRIERTERAAEEIARARDLHAIARSERRGSLVWQLYIERAHLALYRARGLLR